MGFPVSPILSWEVRTKRTFGAILKLFELILLENFYVERVKACLVSLTIGNKLTDPCVNKTINDLIVGCVLN